MKKRRHTYIFGFPDSMLATTSLRLLWRQHCRGPMPATEKEVVDKVYAVVNDINSEGNFHTYIFLRCTLPRSMAVENLSACDF